VSPSLRTFVVSLVLVALAVSACATPRVAPIGAGGRPFTPAADEQALWARAEKEEETFLERSKVYDDPVLEQYLGRIGDRLVPPEVRAAGGPAWSFVVVRDPTLNAFAMPNGRVYVHTGLLSRLDNEAQLATILGHEMTHVTHRHALSRERDARDKESASTVVGMGLSIGVAAAGSSVSSGDSLAAALLSPSAGAILGAGLPLAAVAAINGYGPERERDADAGGIASLVRAGYDVREAQNVFARLWEESSERGPIEVFFYGNPLTLQERLDATSQLVRARQIVAPAVDAARGTEEFRMRMLPVVRENALLDIRAGRFGLAQRQLDRVLEATPQDALAQLYYGDLYRLQSQRATAAADRDDKARLALARYESAIYLDATLPDSYRQLGLLYFEQKEIAKARAALEKYLALTPDAPDARRIKEYIVELDR
jgi:predicted Zn-dependent protease